MEHDDVSHTQCGARALERNAALWHSTQANSHPVQCGLCCAAFKNALVLSQATGAGACLRRFLVFIGDILVKFHLAIKAPSIIEIGVQQTAIVRCRKTLGALDENTAMLGFIQNVLDFRLRRAVMHPAIAALRIDRLPLLNV